MMDLTKLCVILCALFFNGINSYGHKHKHSKDLKQVFGWKQIGFDFDGVEYVNNTDSEDDPNVAHGVKDESDRFFIPYNNVPIGMEVYGGRGFITVPRRRHGIPSTLNYVDLHSPSPLLKPYPDASRGKQLVSVYRPRVDDCGRLWVVDTGLLEVPDGRKQVQPPAIIVFDLETNEQILRYELKASSDLVNERTPGGLTSITVDATPTTCADAHAYITDLATGGAIVFSLADNDSWRVDHASFKHDETKINFTVAGQVINWKDGLFSLALSDPDQHGKRVAYYHPLVSTQEFSVDTQVLKSRGSLEGQIKVVGDRGPLTQSGSHAYHGPTRTLLFANVAQDAILCWRVNTDLTPDNVAIVKQDHKKLVYISDLKVVGDDVWVLVNQIPRVVYSTLDPDEINYYVHKGRIQDLIRGTVCDQHHHH